MESFPHDALAKEYPQTVEEWKTISETQNVPHEWVMFAELGMVSFVTPTAVLQSNPSTCTLLLGSSSCTLGARNTSNLLRLYRPFFDVAGSRARSDCEHRARRWETEHGAGRVLRNQKKASLEQLIQRANWKHSAGSLEGEGRVMARPQNRGRSCEFQAEDNRTCSWVQQEEHVNEATVTELHKRYKWKRTTINGDKSFGMSFPFFGCIGAVHLPDFTNLYVESDPLASGLCQFLLHSSVYCSRGHHSCCQRTHQ